MEIRARYQQKLSSFPQPGLGNGFHGSLLGAATLGVLAGIAPEQLHSDIRGSIPPGKRRIADREIQDAISKAMKDHGHGGVRFIPPKPRPVVNDGQTALRKIIESAKITMEADLWEASPIRLWGEPEHDSELFLSTLFRPDDHLFIGERHKPGKLGENIRSCEDWKEFFRKNGKAGPFIIQNPLSGHEELTHDDKPSFRCDNAVKTFRYSIVEHDQLPREDQIAFWSVVKLPIRALVCTGGKSVHAWMDCSCLAPINSHADWQREIKDRLYEQGLKPLGFDSSCANPARLSRLPGYFRHEKENWQRLLWLSPEGRPIT